MTSFFTILGMYSFTVTVLFLILVAMIYFNGSGKEEDRG